MFNGMSNTDTVLLERISATAIVNQAVMKCGLAGMEITHDNVIAFIGDFADPDEPDHSSLISEIQRSIDEVMCSVLFHQSTRSAVH